MPAEPVPLAARTPRAAAALVFAARTPPPEGVGLAGWLNEVAADFGHDREPVVRRLGGVLRRIVSERALAGAPAPAPAATPAALALFLQRTVVTLAPARDLFVIVFAGRFSRVLLLRLERDRFLDDRGDVFRRLHRLRFALDAARQFAPLDRVVVCAG